MEFLTSSGETIEVAALLPTDVTGGHERMLIEWLSQARALGLHATIYSRSNWELADRVRELGFAWRNVNYGIDRRDALRRTQWMNFLRTLLVARRMPARAAVLLAPGGMQFGLVHVLACLLARRKVVCYVPMTYGASLMRLHWPAFRDWLARRVARCVSIWITISDEQKRRLADYWGVKVPVYVIPNRLRILESPAKALGKQRQGPPLRLLYAGRFDHIQKGLDWLADVLVARYEWLGDVRVTFEGKGSYLARLEALRYELGGDRVQVLPWAELTEAFSAHDVLILPSRYEGLPLVAIEAIWDGIPVIATRTSGLCEILPEECFFDSNDLESFRAVLERVRIPERRDAIVAVAREKVGRLLNSVSFRAALQEVVGALARLSTGPAK